MGNLQGRCPYPLPSARERALGNSVAVPCVQYVELAMLMNIIAATQDIDRDMPSPLRGECVKEVNGSMGIFVLRMP